MYRGGCTAHSTFSADIAGRHWTEQDPNTYGNLDVVSSNTALLAGNGFLSPSPTVQPADNNLSVSLEIFGSGLLTNGGLPAALPSPTATAASHGLLSFSATTEGGGSPYFSYTGQTCAASAPSPPTIYAAGTVPLYSSSTTIQPGSWVSIFGSNLAAAAATWDGTFPTSLGGTSVTIDNKPAYLWYVSPGQINLQAPDDTARGTVNVVVTTAGGSATSTVILGQFGPSFNLLDGKHVAGIILRTDGSGAFGGGTYDVVGPTGTSLGYKTVAAKAGDLLELFGIGFGPTNPSVSAGKAYTGAAVTTNPVSLTINQVTVAPSFAGITSAGLYQINLKLPSGLGSGDVPLRALVGGVQTPASVVLSVQ